MLIGRVSASQLEGSTWLPSRLAGPAAVAMRAGVGGRTITQSGGEVLEGWRVSESATASDFDPRAATTPVYRQGNIKQLRLQLGPQHWSPPQIEGRWCVRPGDVVMNKFAPVRAAFISPAAKRHPVDGNTLIVRDLPRPEAAWLALCLNDRAYEQLLVLDSGVLERVGLKSLSALRLPPAPQEMDSLSARLRDALDDQTLTSETMTRLRAEADELTRAAPTPVRSLRCGAFLARDAVAHESWLPSATVLRAEQAALAENFGWVALAELASWENRARLAEAPEGARPLRLRDVGEDLFVAPADDARDDAHSARLLASPLVSGEVLLSTLGSSFRAAYVDDEVPRNTFPMDGWVRVRFRETPAAWALLLSTDALRSQAARLAVGSVQQFVPPESLRSLRVPVPPRDVRDRWQRSIERHHAQRRTQDRQWAALVSEMTAVFEAVHRPFAASRLRAKENLQ